ncbi:MAG: leucyl/phenylalanyl-tRNA--protein transferase [Armatimonadetes bacterium]|nr:leucyl/phenylalanyl-tRNA--protein transferase [Armatimonadota bacterium]
MADPAGRVRWYTADPRAILELDDLHVPQSLRKTIKRGIYEIRVNTSFRRVMQGCAARSRTWISRSIIDAYSALHERGWAHSVEAWRDGALQGGLYGLAMGGAFFGESMFAAAPDASKVCVVALVERLRARGYVLLDCQELTNHMARFGATLIPAEVYLRRLRAALRMPGGFSDDGGH